MSQTFFTTDDGDIILRANSESDSKHDFRVHKLILSLASPVFKDMFTFPQPPDQVLNELPVVDVPESPEVLDTVLRFIYPGVEPPKALKPPTLTALLFAADKYDIASMSPYLKENLKSFLSPHDRRSLWVYIVARRFGFLEVAKEAAQVSNGDTFPCFTDHADLQFISSADLFRLVQFVQSREREGLWAIASVLDASVLVLSTDSLHSGEDAQDYYYHLQKAVEETFVRNPCVGQMELLAVLDTVPDPPPGCDPPSKPGEWYSGGEDGSDCPVQPMNIRRRLQDVAIELRQLNIRMMNKFFGKEFETLG
jgi:hypothetical protein